MSSKARRIVAGALLASVAAVGLTSPAMAESPVTIPPGDFVVDNSNVLGSDVSQLEDQISQLRKDTGYSLFAIYVDEFTNPENPQDWAKEVFNKKNMGTNDVILVVGTESRQAFLGSSNNSPVNEYRQEIFSNDVLPALSDDDWLGAAEGAIAGIENVDSGAIAGSGSSNSSSGFSFFWVMIVIAGGAVVAFMVLSRRGKSKSAQLPTGQRPGSSGVPQQQLVPLDQLRRQADQLLVAADDSIRSSEQELGFAEAQYGKESIEVFTQDLAQAKQHLSESFRLQQQLDDDIPDTEQDQRSWLGEIINRCGQVNETLQKHAEDFKKLRQLEQNAETRITEVAAEQEPLNQQLSARVAILEQLTDKYDQSAVSQILDNAKQASDRLSFAASALKQASEQLGSDRANAALLIQNAEEAQDQAEVLLEAINKSATALSQAESDLESAVALASRDVAQAQALVNNGSQPALAGPVAGVLSALNNIKQSINSKHNPLALIAQLDQASKPLATSLANLRNQAEQEQAAREQLQSLLHTAESRINGTEDYIRARRGGVRSSARTRLSEAQRAYDDARSQANRNPSAAVASAQRAIQLADQAASMAEQDVNGFGGGDVFGGGYGGRGRGRGGMFDGIGGAVLGGILIDSILHGGHGGGNNGDGGMFGGGGFGGFGGGGGGFGGGDGGGFGGSGGSF
ncbi:TPM domain-containing protein [Glutamicibacter soli]|uniref:TPM domain-containing protein n=1 Tax=Glutamicibacter soli TaxID=453836 RepID=UPI003FCF468B